MAVKINFLIARDGGGDGKVKIEKFDSRNPEHIQMWDIWNEQQPSPVINHKTALEYNRKRGQGGAPTRATILPDDAAGRKKYPVASGLLDYFPDALCEISRISQKGGDQHHPGAPIHWERGKSSDESDTMMRHFMQRGLLDTDGTRHSAKLAWRALAILQKEIEAEQDAEIDSKISLGDKNESSTSERPANASSNRHP